MCNQLKNWDDLLSSRNFETYCADISYSGEDILFHHSKVEYAAVSLLKIYQIIDKGYGGIVKSSEYNGYTGYYQIRYDAVKRKFIVFKNCVTPSHIAFHTEEQANEFLSDSKNIKLFQYYYMV